MDKEVGISLALEQKYISEENETPFDTAGLLKFVLITLAILALIGLGVYFGFLLWGNNNNRSSSQGLNQPVPSDISALLGNESQSSSSTAGGWSLYTDINFSFKYPVSWLLKRGYAAKDDLIVYDPRSIKQTTQNGSQNRLPTTFLDITSVTASSKSAAETVAVYVDSMKQKNVTIQTEQSPTYKSDMVLFDDPGGNGKSIIWSHSGMQAVINTSLQHLTDNSTENTILQSFQFIQK